MTSNKEKIIAYVPKGIKNYDAVVDFIKNDLHGDWLRKAIRFLEDLKASGEEPLVRSIGFDDNGYLFIDTIEGDGKTFLR